MWLFSLGARISWVTLNGWSTHFSVIKIGPDVGVVFFVRFNLILILLIWWLFLLHSHADCNNYNHDKQKDTTANDVDPRVVVTRGRRGWRGWRSNVEGVNTQWEHLVTNVGRIQLILTDVETGRLQRRWSARVAIRELTVELHKEHATKDNSIRVARWQH